MKDISNKSSKKTYRYCEPVSTRSVLLSSTFLLVAFAALKKTNMFLSVSIRVFSVGSVYFQSCKGFEVAAP